LIVCKVDEDKEEAAFTFVGKDKQKNDSYTTVLFPGTYEYTPPKS